MGNETYSYDEVELMAVYENISKIPNENRVTSWWGDMDMYEFKFGVKDAEVRARFNEALKSVGMSREEFERYKYTYRKELENRMRENIPQKYEVVVIFNKPMLFTCERLDRNKVPEGIFCYDIRHDDNCGGDMVEIKDKVGVNHWGTVMSKEKAEPRIVDGIEMNSKTGIVMTEDDYNYTGIEVSVEEYLKNYREFENEYCEPIHCVKEKFMDTRFIDLVAAYENVLNIPENERVTRYYSKQSMNYIKSEKDFEIAYGIKEKALELLEMTHQEFENKTEFAYQSEMEKGLEDSLGKFKCISECADKNILFQSLDIQGLNMVEGILGAYSEGKIDLFIPRDSETDEVNFDDEFDLIVNEQTYTPIGIEETVLKWYEGFEDGGYMIETVEIKIYEISTTVIEEANMDMTMGGM